MARVPGLGRASPQAIEKRRAARALNTLFRTGGPPALDGRTANRRKRLVKELIEGRRGKPLSPIDVLTHVAELFAMGETLASLRKLGVKRRSAPLSTELALVARRVMAAYDLPADAFYFVGVEISETADRKKGGRT